MKNRSCFTKLLPILAVGFLMAFLSVTSNEHAFSSAPSSKSAEGKRTVDKAVIFIFSDGLKSQFTNAKPILDKYGFKATFDIVCNYVGAKNGYMDWDEIKELNDEGNDIGSHSMSHVRLTGLSEKSIEYEVGESKKCLDDYGITPISFEYPFSTGSEDKNIVDIVAKHYKFATRGNDPLMFLKCDGMKQYGQDNCKTFTENGIPTYANKYSIRNWSHDFEIVENSYSESEALDRFIEVVNSQSQYNNDGNINAIPIIMYHDIGNTDGTVTNIRLFEKEMKYLHDNNFHVITISDLSYDEKDHYLYVKDVALEPKLPRENVTAPVVEPTENITANITVPANITAPVPVEVPPINATANVTAPAPVEVPPINATANVTSPLTLGSNQTIDIVKKVLGIP
ncbi:MAG TPA: polysaccharide deacetylase family protein [Nitrososphaeraceae archaeon]|nr:polysaccharide deacetylase family protein [Nitrososphaeraceae archaeon]